MRVRLSVAVRQFGLEDVKPQIGKTVVPIYEPPMEQENDLGLSAMVATANIVSEISSGIGSLLNVHGEDYEETAFQRRLRAQQKKRKGRRM